jgi:hypothetical protein
MSTAIGAISRAVEKSDKNGTLGGACQEKDEKEKLNAQMSEATLDGSEEEEEDEEEDKLGQPNLGPRVSIKEQLEKDKVCFSSFFLNILSCLWFKFVSCLYN